MKVPGKAPGVSLAEAVVALFLLTAGVLVVGQAFVQCLRYQRESLQYRQAALEAENIFAALRRYRDGFPASGQSWANYWSSYAHEVVALPGFEALVEVRAAAIYSPSTSLEEHFGSRARRLPESAMDARLTLGFGRRRVSFESRLGPPPLQVDQLSLQRLDSGPLARDGFAHFRARALDSGGREIEGICYRWRVECDASTHQPGMATLHSPGARDDREMQVYHRLYRPDMAITYAPGRMRVVVSCRNGGAEISASQSLELNP